MDDQAYVFAAARADLWDSWPRLPRRVRELVGHYWHVREDDLASRDTFSAMARAYAASSDGLYRLPEDVAPREAQYLVVAHAQNPLKLAKELVREAEELFYQARSPLPVAGPGQWCFGGRELSVVTIPDSEKDAQVRPLPLRTAAYRPTTAVSRKQVLRLARRQAAADPDRYGWKPGLMDRFFDKLIDADDHPVTRLALPAGQIRVLNAPTGVGKSVLMDAIAPLLAQQGQGPIAVVVGQIHDSLRGAERIQADNDLVRQAADQLAAATAGQDLRIVPLVSPYRRTEQAERALTQGRQTVSTGWPTAVTCPRG
ncbi:hypothetical protein [Streptomyces sp. NBC_01361]|uniref:hypothetical protein n=1 Tax=Streptomyces sp. NBC_01361 TaxID=2903838 RepID=UPI002E3609BE|nr:hypothetical protein [Streptomyces sp. NBC_01361]